MFSDFLPEVYFSGLQVFAKPIKDKRDANKSEKIKLEFSIENPCQGSISISIKLYDEQAIDFFTELKSSYILETLKFEKFFICDYKFQKIQKIDIAITKNGKGIYLSTTLADIINSKNLIFKKQYEGEET